MLSGLERRRRDKLQQQGIYSTHKSAHFTSPLGLPCNPQTSPLLCGNITDITDPTKPADELRRERRERKEDRERVRDINNKYKELTGDLPRNRGRRTGERATGERTTGDRTTGDRTTGDRTTGDRANRKRERAGQPGHINEVFDSTAKLDPFADDPFADDPFPDDPFPDDPFIDNMD
ncbi:hypothetical protein GNI_063320 [Gregarina niphandrodes]|uniref:Uncharacterized protein n=1 Tax=Gregarina niphandrodes TaxID=110365 RepID=A0A023B826_GRENI|nr:hypothetical protein GNI_063320 [Gregarina niphandrodes]EZG68211.1 hypothetical protein GNI_063320 [Gregarina niphandrodes]|eukprot:XP_011130033.1 hypothetical protein GNI_063320 [Gregarina niphandrodes]